MVVAVWAAGTGTLSVADTAGNTWIPLHAATTVNSTFHGRSFYAIANGSSSTTITLTSTAGGNLLIILYDEFSGIDTVNPISATNIATANPGTNPTVTVTPTDDNCAIYAACFDATGVTAVGAGYTLGVQDANPGDWTEFQILTGGNGVGKAANFTAASGAYLNMGAAFAPPGVTPLTVTASDTMSFSDAFADTLAAGSLDTVSLTMQWQIIVN